MTAPKQRYPRLIGLQVARELRDALTPACERLIFAGSLRRGRPDVGDVELIFIPKVLADRPVPGDMFKTAPLNLAEAAIAHLETKGILSKRENATGGFNYGPQNKLMRHCETGLPVDLFTASEANWFNYLVCRTGPAESNTRIAQAAQAIGWKWNPYGSGFTRDKTGEIAPMASEEAVFAFVGLPYHEPRDRT